MVCNRVWRMFLRISCREGGSSAGNIVARLWRADRGTPAAQSAKRRRQRLCHRRTLVGHHQPCRAMLETAPRRGGTRAGPAVCAFSRLRNNVFPCAGASLYPPAACASFSAGAAASAWTAGDVYAALALSGGWTPACLCRTLFTRRRQQGHSASVLWSGRENRLARLVLEGPAGAAPPVWPA